jgi:hypothetical protein
VNRRSAMNALRNEIAWRSAVETRNAHARYVPPGPTPCHGGAHTHHGQLATAHWWTCTCGAHGKDFATADEMLASLQAHLPVGAPCEYTTSDTRGAK